MLCRQYGNTLGGRLFQHFLATLTRVAALMDEVEESREKYELVMDLMLNLTSLREVVTRHKQQEAAEVSADLSSDTEDCEAEDLEPDTLTSRPEDMVDGCSPLPADTPAAAVMDTPAVTASADTPAVAAAEALPAASSDSSFVVVHSPVHGPGPAMKPGDGYTWCRQVGP